MTLWPLTDRKIAPAHPPVSFGALGLDLHSHRLFCTLHLVKISTERYDSTIRTSSSSSAPTTHPAPISDFRPSRGCSPMANATRLSPLNPTHQYAPNTTHETRDAMSTVRRSCPVCGSHTCRGGLVFKAHRLLYHPTLGLRVIEKKKKKIPASAVSHHLYLELLALTCLVSPSSFSLQS